MRETNHDADGIFFYLNAGMFAGRIGRGENSPLHAERGIDSWPVRRIEPENVEGVASIVIWLGFDRQPD